MHKILIVDDDEGYLKSISNLLEYKKFNVSGISNPQIVEDHLKRNNYDCLLLDVQMPQIDGIALLKKIQKLNPFLPIIMISNSASISNAVEAIKNGAYDFYEKDSGSERLLVTLQNAIEKVKWNNEKKELISQIESSYKMVGKSKIFLRMIRQIETLAKTDAKVLILGESGTGKELVARALHYKGDRSGKPFISFNCAAIPSELLESQLFGHKKGIFTGATYDYDGKFVQANGGTLFLDEIADMDLKLQAKLLRILQDGEVEPLGANKSEKVNVRIICATNKDLGKLVKDGFFREDLYYRINVIRIIVPPLRERKEDIPEIARFYLHKFASEKSKRLIDFDPQAIALLMDYDWPGNIRELENIIEKVSIFTENTVIHSEDIYEAMDILPDGYEASANNPNLEAAKNNFEKEFILKYLDANEWRIIDTAKDLGIDRTTLFKRMKKYGIKKREVV